MKEEVEQELGVQRPACDHSLAPAKPDKEKKQHGAELHTSEQTMQINPLSHATHLGLLDRICDMRAEHDEEEQDQEGGRG